MSLIKNINVKEDKKFGVRIFMALVVGVFALSFFATSAHAGLGVGVTPDFPATATVGQTSVPVGLEITNNSTPDVGTITLSNIRLIPSCGDTDADSTTCAGAEVDPGVFTVSANGTGTDACAAITFTTSVNDVTTGQVLFTPSSPVSLVPGATCRINFTVNVNQTITDDSSPNAGMQTLQIGRVSAANDGLSGTGLGTDEVTIVAQGHIIVNKITNPSGDPQSFSFTTTGSGYTPFSLTDTATPNDQTLNAGTYSVAETLPSGWDQTSATCTSSIQDTETPGTLELDAGETITCTFTNTKRGHIIVVKNAEPNNAQDFTFTNNFANGNPGTFNLDDDSDGTLSNSRDSEVLPGTFSISEGSVAGWTQTSATCSDGSPVSAVVVSAGETVTCTFTNTQQQGHIVVDKITVPTGDTQSFSFTTTGSGYTPFSLTDAATPNDQTLSPGTYSVAETAIEGWNQTSVVCTSSTGGSENPTSISLAAGETVTCTFTNTQVVAQGCSPGYWKQAQHFGSYPDGVYPNSLFSDVFTGSTAFPDMTLLQVLNQSGGGINALGRIMVGAYLNASTVDEFPYTPEEVITAFNEATPSTYNSVKTTFEALQDPCPFGKNPGPAGPEENERSIEATLLPTTSDNETEVINTNNTETEELAEVAPAASTETEETTEITSTEVVNPTSGKPDKGKNKTN
jgi:hypothetical protein